MHLEESAPFATATRVFLLALGFRLLALPLSLLSLNPYSEHDAVAFERVAGKIATGIIIPSDPLSVYHVWGSILAPFYWLPGPAGVYSRLFVALLGAASIYFVYQITCELHSQRAAVYGTLPMVVLPSFVLIHVSLIREAPVLFFLTLIAYVLIVAPDWASVPIQVGVTIFALTLLTMLRKENLPFYLLALGLGLAIQIYYRFNPTSVTKSTAMLVGGGVSLLATPLIITIIQWGLRTVIGPNRRRRARGNSMYLPQIIPNDLITAFWFTPIGVMYFYFAPFPWMIEGPRYVPVFFEGVVNLGFAIAALSGAWTLLRRRQFHACTISLLVAFTLLSVLYGLVEANIGAAIRHRQMLIWVMYMLGGIGLADHLIIDVSPMEVRLKG